MKNRFVSKKKSCLHEPANKWFKNNHNLSHCSHHIICKQSYLPNKTTVSFPIDDLAIFFLRLRLTPITPREIVFPTDPVRNLANMFEIELFQTSLT